MMQFDSRNEGLNVEGLECRDVARTICQALPRPRVCRMERLFAAPAWPASAVRLYQFAAARQSAAATPLPSSSMIPMLCIAFGNPASAPLVYHPTACSYSFHS
jgi:hypothetical protein